MEESRLKPMAVGYDEKLFNQIYKETEPLRRKLAGQIDARRFGLFYDDILSFFDIKVIFVFNKHWLKGDPPQKIKACILNALSNFKCRILRQAYTLKYSQSILSLDELINKEDWKDDSHEKDEYYEKMMSFMQNHLSDNAYVLLEIQLNPPPFILKKINPGKDKPLQKIPDHILLEYFDLGSSENAYRYLNKLKKEIRNAINLAKSSLN